MAEDNKFRIGTELDLSGIQKGAKLLDAELAKIKKKIEQTAATTAAPTGSKTNSVVPNIDKDTKDLINMFRVTQTGVKDTNDNLDKFTKKTSQSTNALADVGRRVFVWGSLSAAIFGAISSIKEFYDFTLKVNTSLAELRKVLPQGSDFEAFKGLSFDFAIEFGADPTEVIQLFKRFAQAGLDVADAINASRVALLALNTTGADVEQTINALIGANRIFNVEWENMGRVIDKVQRIQADFAVDAKDLIESITTIGPAITTLGGDIDDLFSTIGAMGEAARVSGKQASNSLKRVFSRLTTREGIQALQELGVAVMATNDTYRPLRDIFDDIAIKLKDASAVQKTNVAITLAQVRQYSKFLALMQNYDRALEAREKSELAFGDAITANRYIMETYEKRAASASAQVSQLWENVISGGATENITQLKEALGSIAGGMNFLLDGANDVIPGFNQLLISAIALKGTMTAVRLVLGSFKGEQYKIITGQKVINALRGKELALTKAQQKSLDMSALKVSKLSRIMAGAVGGIGLAFALAPVLEPITSGFVSKIRELGEKLGIALTESTKDIIESYRNIFKGLGNIDIENFDPSNLSGKFSKIENVLSSVSVMMENGAKSTDILSYAIRNLVDSSAQTINTQGLEKLSKVVSFLNSLLLEGAGKEFAKQIYEINNKLTPVFSDLQDSLEGFGNNINDISKSKKQLAAIRKLFYSAFNDSGGVLTGSMFREIEKAQLLFNQTITDIVNLKDEYSKLKNITDKSVQLKLQSDIKDKAKPAAEALLKVINVEKVFEKAAIKTGIALKNVNVSSSLNAEAEAVKDIYKEVINLINIQGGDFLSKVADKNGVIKALTESIKELEKESKSFNKTVLIDADIVAILSSVKKSVDFVSSSYRAQIEMIDLISSKTNDLGGSYNVIKEKLDATNGAIKNFISMQKESAGEISIVSKEIAVLNSMVKGMENVSDIGFFADQSGKAGEKIQQLKIKLIGLQKIQEENNKKIGAYLSQLESVRSKYEQIVEVQNQNLDYTKKNTQLFENLAKASNDFASALGSNPFEEFAIDNNTYEQLIAFNEETLSTQLKMKDITEEQYKTEYRKLRSAAVVNRQQKALSAIVKAVSDRYNEVKRAAEDIVGVNYKIASSIITARTELESLGKNRVTDNVIGIEISAIKQRGELEKNRINLLAEQKIISRSNLDIELARVDANIKQEIVEARINDALERRRELQSKLDTDVDSMKSSLVGFLTDIDSLLEDFTERSSGLTVLARGIDQVGRAMGQIVLKAQAEIISDKLSGAGEKLVSRVREGVVQGMEKASLDIEDAFIQTQLPDKLKNSLDLGSRILSKMIYESNYNGITSAFKFVDSEILSPFKNLLQNTINTQFEKQQVPEEPQMPNIENLENSLDTSFFSKYYEQVKNKVMEIENSNAAELTAENTAKLVELAGGISAQMDQSIEGNKQRAKEPSSHYSTNPNKLNFSYESDSPKNDLTNFFNGVDFDNNYNLPYDMVPAKETASNTSIGNKNAQDYYNKSIYNTKQIINKLEEMKSFSSDSTKINIINSSDPDPNIEKMSTSNDIIMNTGSDSFNMDKLHYNSQVKLAQETNSYLSALLKIRMEEPMSVEDINMSNDTLSKWASIDSVGVGKIIKEQKKAGKNLSTDSISTSIMQMLGSYLTTAIGAQIASNSGRDTNLVPGFQGLGTGIGTVVGGPIGGIVGGLFGSVLGGLFGSKKEEEQEETQTTALIQIATNTGKMVDQLSPELFNAPSGFSLPSKGAISMGNPVTIQMTNTFKVNGGTDVVNQINQALNDAFSRSTSRVSTGR